MITLDSTAKANPTVCEIYTDEYIQGYGAYHAGLPIMMNPYRVTDYKSFMQLSIFSSWQLGWSSGLIQHLISQEIMSKAQSN